MKLKSAGFIAAATIMCTAANANANMLFDVYAGATAGLGGQTVFVDGDHVDDSAQSYGAVVGLDIPVFRFELEYDYLTAPDVDMHLGMINAYAKMPLPMVKPYLGAGVGNVFSGKINNGPDVDNTIAYQAMLGLTFALPVLPFNIDAEQDVPYTSQTWLKSVLKHRTCCTMMCA